MSQKKGVGMFPLSVGQFSNRRIVSPPESMTWPSGWSIRVKCVIPAMAAVAALLALVTSAALPAHAQTTVTFTSANTQPNPAHSPRISGTEYIPEEQSLYWHSGTLVLDDGEWGNFDDPNLPPPTQTENWASQPYGSQGSVFSTSMYSTSAFTTSFTILTNSTAALYDGVPYPGVEPGSAYDVRDFLIPGTGPGTGVVSLGSGYGYTFSIQSKGDTEVGSGFGNGGGALDGVSILFDTNTANRVTDPGAPYTALVQNPSTVIAPTTVVSSNPSILVSGNPVNAVITYNGTSLTVTLTDSVSGLVDKRVYTVNIASSLNNHGPNAYFGLTRGESPNTVSAVTVNNWTYSPATATFVNTDTTTQGSWKGNYGGDGWNVLNDSSSNNPSYPSYATVTPTGNTSGVWASSSLAANCPQVAAVGSAARMAGVWFNTSWSMNVDVAGMHQLALYLLDYGNSGYAENITITDASTGTVLDTESASSLLNGKYYVWNVSGNVTVTFTATAGHWAVLSGIFFGPGTGSTAPQPPTSLAAPPGSASASLSWTASTGATSYNVYRGTTSGGESTTPIASGITTTLYTDTGLTPGTTYYYRVEAVNGVGGSPGSGEASAAVPTATASFVTADTTTQGSWKGNYGGDGWNVLNDSSSNNPSYPSYATVTPTGNTSGVWASSSLAANCPQVAAVGSAARMAGVWFNTSWSMAVDVSGTHQLALYLLDYGNSGYAETITIKDASSGTVLDTESASSLVNGKYYVWDVSGDVTVTFTATAGHWAVLSGIFFGPGSGLTAPMIAPTGLIGTPSSGQVALTWSASTGATSYNVYRGTTSGGESTTPIASGVTTTSYTDTGLTSGTTYYYEIVAVNAIGGSPGSSEAHASVP